VTDYLGDSGPVDEISQDTRFSLPSRSPQRAGANPGARLTALTTALALVLTGGVVTAAWRSFESHSAPEHLVPSTAFAIGTFDLGMRGQSDALMSFANHFPGSPTHHGDGSAVDRLLRAVMRGSSDPHVDYDRDIKPWLGNHVALAGWIDKAGKPQMEGLLETTDESAARHELDKLMKDGNGAVTFTDGYAVLGNNPAAVKESVDAAHRSSLADNKTYAADIEALPGDPALTGWIDGPGVLKAIESALSPGDARMFERMGPMGPLSMFGPMGLMGAAGTAGVGSAAGGALGSGSALAGRTAVGVRVADNYLEIDARSTGAKAQHQSSTASLRTLPATTIAAVELGDPSSLVNAATGMLKEFIGLPTHVSVDRCAVAIPEAVPPASAIPMNVPHRKRLLRELARARNKVRVTPSMPGKAGCPRAQTFPFRPPQPPDPLKQIEKSTGLQLPGDATTVVGDSLLASYGGLSLTGVPKVAVRTHPGDLSAAQLVLDKVQTRLGVMSDFPLAVDTSGDDLVLATSSDYAHDVEQTGSFGDEAQVQLALGSLPDAVEAAGYVDLSKVLPLLGSLPRDVQALKAIGFWTTQEGGVQQAQLRIVVG
jgi:hypothetical protein